MSGNGEVAPGALAAPLEALEGPRRYLLEVPADGGGLDLFIYDVDGWLVDVSFVPPYLDTGAG
ncbi:hypothetical protein OG234_13260 [Streptomyces sp. NBC_01420]|uniref:hypothetical protein n=1 Tax=Streptomyces sp. NBC_01420 TaxID=2903858 RepID=UPI003249C39D